MLGALMAGFPGALGALVSHSGTPVVAFAGALGALMSHSDLAVLNTTMLVGGALTIVLGGLSLRATRRERHARALVERRLHEREAAERARATAEKRFRTAFAQAPIGMALIELSGRFLQVNKALAKITGYAVADLLAVPSGKLTHPEDRRADDTAVAFMRNGTMQVHDVEKRYLQAGGSVAWVSVHTTLIRDEDGRPAYFLSQIQDVTTRRKYESRLQYMADHDPLTGLLNRRAYERILADHLAQGERYGHEGAVLMLDLDEFKPVNDTLGHSAGDDLIVRVGRALAERLRGTDTVARLGGDEFAILLPKGAREDAEHVAAALLEAIRTERSVRGPKGLARPISASIGVAPLTGAQGITAEEALINADLAMYDAKEAGRNRFETYDDSRVGQAGIEARLEWVERIRTALEEDHFTLHAQPVVEAASGEITQLELLVRMLGPDGELIMPGSFLPIAERFGLIGEIDRWVVTKAIRMLAEQGRRGLHPKVEINLSGHSLGDPELATHIDSELRSAEVDPTQLVFEVTETAAIGNIEAAQHFAERLAKLGCQFALDDFGAGFGSFYYLKHLPFDFIKIDGEFVRNLTADETDRLVITAVVELARGLGKRTIAEFVGDEATVTALRDLGVDYLQGFHLGKPAPIESWLAPLQAPAAL
jgi:diguanylate cyclase (GGDEF)-like protein/PAS domain S-box-containing protein